MKKNFFDFQRFWTYFKYDFKQMGRNHVKAAIGFGLAGLILYFLVVLVNLIFNGTWQGPGEEGRWGVFALACIALPFYYTRTYGYLTDKRKGSAWLMLPASTFEKWLSMMLLSLILLPVLFFVSSFLVDWLICLADPTVGESMIGVLTGKVSAFNSQIVILNEVHSTSWGIGSIAWPLAVSFLGNLLYFLLCGLCFKRNKILGAIAVSIGISMVLSLIFSGLGSFGPDELESVIDEGPTTAQTILRWVTAISALIAAGLSAGIYYRLKTLKH